MPLAGHVVCLRCTLLQFWRNVSLNPPLYGADVPGSLFDPETKVGGAAQYVPWHGMASHDVA